MSTSLATTETAVIYNGGYFPDDFQWYDKLLHGVGVAILYLGAIFSLCVMVEIFLFGKLRFQINRILFFLMVVNLVTCVTFAVHYTSQLASAPWLFYCPRLEGVNLFMAIENGCLIVALLAEFGIVIVANYSLFYSKREVNVHLEYGAYVLSTALFIIITIPYYVAYAHESENHACGKSLDEAVHSFKQDEISTIVIVSILIAAITLAYIFLFFNRKRQKKLWAEQLEATENKEFVYTIQVDVHQRLVQAHKEIVKEVVDVLDRTVIAFLISFIGYIVFLLGYIFYKRGTEFDSITFELGIDILRNTQPLLQALAYMTVEPNKSNFKLVSWRRRYKAVKGMKHVSFSFDDDVDAYAANL
eukprot:m.3456 g.3456  ORF g.3456 m.3456 type:complete len:359 (-) comp2773_c0_seq2:148-1224(-)